MSTALVWFRNDLRINDNPALDFAMRHHDQVILLYIFDSAMGDAQYWWLHYSLKALNQALTQYHTHLILCRGDESTILQKIAAEYPLDGIYWNRQYTAQSIKRDTELKSTFRARGIHIQTFNGYLLSEPWTVLNKQKEPYKVFTPYWKEASQKYIPPEPLTITSWKPNPHPEYFPLDEWSLLPKNPDWAAQFSSFWTPGEQGALTKLEEFLDNHSDNYAIERDIPIKDGTSRLSPHLHFGEISPHKIWHETAKHYFISKKSSESLRRFQAELGWREFSYYLLYHCPDLPKANFNPLFDAFPWENQPSFLEAWQKGKTGYPIIDAGMRELWATGYMHNRVRMIVASFLTKDLFIDWREGAQWFWNTLLDADIANNSASWQWVAGCGADAAPYFRIFNPILQSERFDPDGLYIKKWIPELRDLPKNAIHTPWILPQNKRNNYPDPIVCHKNARQKALACYQSLKNGSLTPQKQSQY